MHASRSATCVSPEKTRERGNVRLLYLAIIFTLPVSRADLIQGTRFASHFLDIIILL